MITDTVERPGRAQVQWAKDRLSRSFLFLMPISFVVMVGAVAFATLGAGVAVMWWVRQAWNDHLARRTIDRARSRGQQVPA